MFGIGIASGMLVFFWETLPKIVKGLRKLFTHLKKKIGSCMKQLWVKKPFKKLMSRRRRNKVHAKRENRLHKSDTQKIETTKDIQNGKRTNNKRTKDATKIDGTKGQWTLKKRKIVRFDAGTKRISKDVGKPNLKQDIKTVNLELDVDRAIVDKSLVDVLNCQVNNKLAN
jgi:hypothetical protein